MAGRGDREGGRAAGGAASGSGCPDGRVRARRRCRCATPPASGPRPCRLRRRSGSTCRRACRCAAPRSRSAWCVGSTPPLTISVAGRSCAGRRGRILDPDRAMALVARRPRSGGPLLRTYALPSSSKKSDGSIPLDVRQPDRVRPRAGRVRRGDEEIAAAIDAGVEDVERAVMMLDRRREDAARQAEPVEIELLRPVDHIADLRPVDEVAAAEDRDAREVREGRSDEIIIVAGARDARVGVEAGRIGLRYSPAPGPVHLVDGVAPAYSNQSKRATGAALGAGPVRGGCASAAAGRVRSRAKSGAIVRIGPPAAWTVVFRKTSTLGEVAARSRSRRKRARGCERERARARDACGGAAAAIEDRHGGERRRASP